MPGFSFSYAAPAFLKTSVSEEAASTVRSAFGAPEAASEPLPLSFPVPESSFPQAASGIRRAVARRGGGRAAAGERQGHEGRGSLDACAAKGVPVRRGSGAGLREVVLCGWRCAVAAREVVLCGGAGRGGAGPGGAVRGGAEPRVPQEGCPGAARVLGGVVRTAARVGFRCGRCARWSTSPGRSPACRPPTRVPPPPPGSGARRAGAGYLDLDLGRDVPEFHRGDDAGERVAGRGVHVLLVAARTLADLDREGGQRTAVDQLRRPDSSRWVATRPASAQRRAVSGLTPRRRAA